MIRTGLAALVVLLVCHRSASAQAVVLLDNLPPADTPLSAEGFSVARFADGDDLFEREVAVRFVVPDGPPLRLARITLGLFRGPEADGAVRVTVRGELDGAPGPVPLDAIDVASAAVPAYAEDAPPVVVDSVFEPELAAGTAYWLVVSPAGPADVARQTRWGVGGPDAVISALRGSMDPGRAPPGPWLVFATDLRVQVEAVPPNRAPVCVADGYATDEDRPLAVAAPGVLANDTDADGDPLAAVLDAAPAHGTLALAGDGSFVYTPARDYAGPDRFRYHARDGLASSAPVDVAIAVAPVNDPPVNTVPGPQSLLLGLGLLETAVFELAVADPDAGAAPVQVTLVATNGRVSLSTTAGLAFSAGDGATDATMTFTGTLPAVNAALTGVRYTPSLLGFLLAGRGTVQLTSDDLGNTGAPGPLTDTDTVLITRG